MKARYLGILLLLLPVAGYSQSLRLADSLHKHGVKYRKSGHYNQASAYLERAFHLYKKKAKDSVWVSAGYDYALSLTDQAKFDQAFHLLELLSKTFYAKKHIPLRAKINNVIGLTYFHTAREDSALKYYKKALKFAKEADSQYLMAIVSNNIGGIYSRQGNYLLSLKYRKESLRVLKKIHKKFGVAILLNNIGYIYENLSLLDSARIYYKKSLTKKKGLDNVDLLATAYNNLASILNKMGYYGKALNYFNKSLELGRQTGTKYELARTLNNIGILYMKLGQEQRSLAYYRRSLKIQKQFSKPISIATNYENIGSQLWGLGKRGKAIQAYKRALELYKQANIPREVASSLLTLASAELEQKSISKFSGYMTRANAIKATLQNPQLLSMQYALMAEFNSVKGRPLLSIQFNKKAVRQASLISRETSVGYLENLAKSFQPVHPDSAIYYGSKAIRIIEEAQSHASSISRFQSGYFKQYAPFYVDIAAWVIANNHNIPLAYKLVEEGKARVLTEQLARRTSKATASLTEKEQVERAKKLSEISNLRWKLKQANNKRDRQKIRNEIQNKQLDYDTFINHIRQTNSEYHLFEKPKPISLEKVQALCPPQTAVLEYALNKKRMIIFMITPKKIKVKTFLLKQDSLSDSMKNLIHRFRHAIISRASRASLQKLSQPLYQRLIAPFQHSLASIKNLLIIPSGYLAYLPFDALIHNNHYLLTRYNIKYVPSMTSFSLICKPNARSLKDPLIIGNSSMYPANVPAPTLVGVDLEMRYLKEIFPDALILTGNSVSEKRVRKLLKTSYSIVHFATHGVVDEQNPQLSGVLVGERNDKNDIRNDGFLRRAEISRLNIPSDLVVLSACETAKGPVISGEGMLGLQQAFLTAGTSTVVVSLWNVYDRATARLMKNFYHLLKENHNSWSSTWHTIVRWFKGSDAVAFGNAAKAMHRAKLNLLHNPKYHDPVFWAPFIVIGK